MSVCSCLEVTPTYLFWHTAVAYIGNFWQSVMSVKITKVFQMTTKVSVSICNDFQNLMYLSDPSSFLRICFEQPWQKKINTPMT